MQENQSPTRTGSRDGYGLDLLLALLLFVVGLGVHWPYAGVVAFPPSDESAFYLTTAENMLTGRGLEVDVLWSYQFPFPDVTHPSHERWKPLTTGLIAAAFALQRAITGVLETSLQTGQMPGLVLGALLSPLTYLFGRRVLPGDAGSIQKPWTGSRWVSIAAALLVALNPTLSYQSASMDSSAPLALLTAWALALAVRRPGDQGGYFAAGLLAALAYLTHTSGLLLLVAIPLAWWLLPAPRRFRTALPDNPAAAFVWEHWPRGKGVEEEQTAALGPSLFNLLDVAVAFALIVTPWLIRNFLTFGTPLPTLPLSQAWLSDYTDTFNYLSHSTLQTWLAQGWQVLLDQRLQALMHNGRIFLLSTFPWGLLALPGLWLLRREWSFFPPLIYGLLLFFGVALLFPISSMAGAFQHSLGAWMPFLALAAIYTLQRVAQPVRQLRKQADIASIAAVLALLLLASLPSTRVLPALAGQQQAIEEQFQAEADWLTQHATPGDVVMTTQTYSLNYASEHPSIVLPGNEPPDAAWAAAQRYGARYLIITQTFGQYPQVLHDQPDPRFRLRDADEATEIYEILPVQQNRREERFGRTGVASSLEATAQPRTGSREAADVQCSLENANSSDIRREPDR